MRIDKLLWCIRAYRSRSIASEQCRLEKVWVNDDLAKASREIREGDIIKIRKGAVIFSFEIIAFPKTRVGAKMLGNFVEDVTTEEELTKMKIIAEQHRQERPRGLGRPTKKERRDIDQFFGWSDEE